MAIIIGCDPGLVTGLVSVCFENDELSNIEAIEVDQMGLGHYMEMLYGHWRRDGDKPTVVIESFIITPQSGKNSQAPWSLENIGVVRFFCKKAGIPLVFQTPAQAKRLATNDLLKTAGLYFPSKGGHKNDAARHALTYILTTLGQGQNILKRAFSEEL